MQTDAVFIKVGNSNQWGNGAKITPLADCFDGLLDVTIVDKFSFLEMPVQACRLMTGTVHKSRRVQCYTGKNIRIIRNEEGPAHADGDWFEAPKILDISIIPSALKVLVAQ